MKGLVKAVCLAALTLPAAAQDPSYNPRLCVMAEQYLLHQSMGLPPAVDFVQRLNRLPYTITTAENGYCRVNYSAPPGRLPIYAETAFRQELGFLRRIPGKIFKKASHLAVTGKSYYSPIAKGLIIGIDAKF